MALDPIIEGPTAASVPNWLLPHVAEAAARRSALSAAEQRLFDSYWLRATGVRKPPLSYRERNKLISYFVP
jgi:hypothetical protein